MRPDIFRFSLLLACALCFCASVPGHAQTVPGSAESGRVQERIQEMETPEIIPEPKVTVPETEKQQAPEGAEKLSFVLKGVQITGMTVYSETEAVGIYGDKVGKTITLGDLFGFAEALTVKYRNDGYILSQVIVPPQEIRNGVVRLRAVEGFVDKVVIQGDSPVDEDTLRGFMNHIRKSRPLQAAVLERNLLLINDIPGVTAKGVLSASKTTPGAADLTIVVERKLVDFTFKADNRGSRFLGPFEYLASTQVNALFGFKNSIAVQGLTAPGHEDFDEMDDRELDFVSATFTQHLGSHGTKLTIGGSITSTQPGFTLAPFDVNGITRSLNATLSHPFIRSRTKNLTGHIKFDYSNIRRRDNVTPGAIEDRLRVIRAGLLFQALDRFLGITTLYAEVSRGLDILNMREEGSVNLTRARGDPEFTKVTAQISRLQRLGKYFEAFIAFKGQKATDNLLSSEEFGVGGVNFGSAYDGSEIVGEHGVAGRVELRANLPLDSPKVRRYQLYTFFDGGNVWDPDNTVINDRIRSLFSAGAGVRVDLTDKLSGTLEIAVPLTRRVQSENDKDPRVFFSLTMRL